MLTPACSDRFVSIVYREREPLETPIGHGRMSLALEFAAGRSLARPPLALHWPEIRLSPGRSANVVVFAAAAAAAWVQLNSNLQDNRARDKRPAKRPQATTTIKTTPITCNTNVNWPEGGSRERGETKCDHCMTVARETRISDKPT